MIPKKIHYCWFGNNKKPKIVLECIESWRRNLPDYEIKEWNESNFDVYSCEFSAEAYKNKKWAYVSDYARMKVLLNEGGIYFDTDVEVLKPFPNDLLQSAFSGIEEFSKLVSPGLVYACESGDKIVAKLVYEYEHSFFSNDSIDSILTINKRITRILDEYGYQHIDKFQCIEGLKIYPSEVFCAYDGKKRCAHITKKTLATHHYAASWLPWHRKLRLKIGTALRHVGVIK